MTLQEARRRSIEAQGARDLRVDRPLEPRVERRHPRDVLNNVPLGQRGSFAVFGVAEASRLFFGKDVSNVSLAEAATIAGVIQQPSALSPFSNPQRCRERRNVVLLAMAEAGYIDGGRGRARVAGAAGRRSARARSRSAVLRRLRQPDARRRLSRADHDHEHRRSTSTRRSICTCSGSRRTRSARD